MLIIDNSDGSVLLLRYGNRWMETPGNTFQVLKDTGLRLNESDTIYHGLMSAQVIQKSKTIKLSNKYKEYQWVDPFHLPIGMRIDCMPELLTMYNYVIT